MAQPTIVIIIWEKSGKIKVENKVNNHILLSVINKDMKNATC